MNGNKELLKNFVLFIILKIIGRTRQPYVARSPAKDPRRPVGAANVHPQTATDGAGHLPSYFEVFICNDLFYETALVFLSQIQKLHGSDDEQKPDSIEDLPSVSGRIGRVQSRTALQHRTDSVP